VEQGRVKTRGKFREKTSKTRGKGDEQRKMTKNQKKNGNNTVNRGEGKTNLATKYKLANQSLNLTWKIGCMRSM